MAEAGRYAATAKVTMMIWTFALARIKHEHTDSKTERLFGAYAPCYGPHLALI
jgi:hypothetical protein